MNRRVMDTLLLVALLLACSALLYLDWRRQGEVELLHERVDTFEGRLRGIASAATQPTQSTFERILRADDDRTLADIAREGV